MVWFIDIRILNTFQTLDSNVQEGGDFDESVAVEEQELVQPHVSPTQEASRSILTQHPGKHIRSSIFNLNSFILCFFSSILGILKLYWQN